MQRVRTSTLILIERHTGIKNEDDLRAIRSPNVEDFETNSRRPGHRQAITIGMDIFGRITMSFMRGNLISDPEPLGLYRVLRIVPNEAYNEDQYVHFHAVREIDYQRLLTKIEKEW